MSHGALEGWHMNQYSIVTEDKPTIKLGFLLLNGFTMISFANAVEVLRMANYLGQKTLYDWRISDLGEGGTRASNGLVVTQTDGCSLDDCDMVFVCGGVNIQEATTPKVKAALRHLAALHIPLGGLCTGAIALAMMGLLDGYRCAVHWESLSAAAEAFPKVQFSDSIYVIDRNRYTCSGGTASLDMILQIIRLNHGRHLATAISEQFVMERIRGTETIQSVPKPDCIGPGYEHVANAIALMQANMDEVLSLHDIAALSNISLRQMERLFNRYCDMSPAQYYLRLRLRRAKELLSQTSLSIMQVTVACGFTTSSHFSKAYRSFYGHSPREQRKPGHAHPEYKMSGSAGLISA